MSTIKTNTLTGTTSAGSIVVTGEGGSTTTNLQQGLAKMWGSFDQRGDVLGSVTSGDTFNVTSITDALEGHIDVSIANDMVNTTYSINAMSHYNGTLAYDEYSRYSGASNMATGSFRIASQYVNGGEQDAYHNGILVHGDLA
jgi:hypothetical protein|tara:strand:+ start:521 stop:946 length:426 start_codon:yes stop_codon:yes gene_type:complete